MKQRSATKADNYLGVRLRAARVEKKMSQADAGEAVGVSFQQIQKYEKGVNRVGASRLNEFAVLFGKPIEWFIAPSDKVGQAMSSDLGSLMLADNFGRRMCEAWLRTDPEERAALLQMAETFARRSERRVEQPAPAARQKRVA